MISSGKSVRSWWVSTMRNKHIANIPDYVVEAANRMGIRPSSQFAEISVIYLYKLLFVGALLLSPYLYWENLRYRQANDVEDSEADLRAFVAWRQRMSESVKTELPADIATYILNKKLELIKESKKVVTKTIPNEENCLEYKSTEESGGDYFKRVCLRKEKPSDHKEDKDLSFSEKYGHKRVLVKQTNTGKICFVVFLLVCSLLGLILSLYYTSQGELPEVVFDILRYWNKIENVLSKQNELFLLTKQVLFLGLLQTVLHAKQPYVSLYTLMMQSVGTYCITYINEVYHRTQWSPFIHIGTASVRHLALSTTNIVLEWTKAVTFIITIIFLLLLTGVSRELEKGCPTPPYLVIATVYWLCSEKICRKALFNLLAVFKLSWCDSLEEYYWPLLLEIFQCVMALLLTIANLLMGNFIIGIAGLLLSRIGYIQVRRFSETLCEQLRTLQQFREASKEELNSLNDRCAICLSDLKTARVTSCLHYYHAYCLLQLIKITDGSALKCPICQEEIEL